MTEKIEIYEEPEYTRRNQLRYAYDIADSMGRIQDPTWLPEMVQLANEDRIKAKGFEIKIDEEFREKYLQELEKPITQGEYYAAESVIGDFSFFKR